MSNLDDQLHNTVAHAHNIVTLNEICKMTEFISCMWSYWS